VSFGFYIKTHSSEQFICGRHNFFKRQMTLTLKNAMIKIMTKPSTCVASLDDSSSLSSLPHLPLIIDGGDNLRSLTLLLAFSTLTLPGTLNILSIHRFIGCPVGIVISYFLLI
jgi:hypothetical protein